MMERSTFRFSIQEFAGSIADLGIMVPLVILLITRNGMNPTAVLLLAGLLYIVSGTVFKVPVPVQPLKAVAIIAIASGLSPDVIAAAGILMGVILLILTLSGLTERLSIIFTQPLIRGIQLGLAGMLVTNGVKMVLDPQFLRGGAKIVFHLFGNHVPAGLLFGVAGGALLLIFSSNPRFPASLVLLLFGIVSGLLFGSFQILHKISIAPTPITFSLPSIDSFGKALMLLVLPQIPLTFGNSLVATADTARCYFGSRADGVTPTRLSISLAIANLFAGLIGAAPLCHGAGGLTAHYRFGARSGAMGVIIGSALVAAALLLGSSAPDLFTLLPPSILGIMLVFVGIEHGMLIRDMLDSREELFVTIAVGTIGSATGNLFAATVIGLTIQLLSKLKLVRKLAC